MDLYVNCGKIECVFMAVSTQIFSCTSNNQIVHKNHLCHRPGSASTKLHDCKLLLGHANNNHYPSTLMHFDKR